MLKILTMNLFYKDSVNIHHHQKMLVTDLVLATKSYSVMNKSPKIIGYTFATRYDAEYDIVECMRNQLVSGHACF